MIFSTKFRRRKTKNRWTTICIRCFPHISVSFSSQHLYFLRKIKRRVDNGPCLYLKQSWKLSVLFNWTIMQSSLSGFCDWHGALEARWGVKTRQVHLWYLRGVTNHREPVAGPVLRVSPSRDPQEQALNNCWDGTEIIKWDYMAVILGTFQPVPYYIRCIVQHFIKACKNLRSKSVV